jgi:hypothetical protein
LIFKFGGFGDVHPVYDFSLIEGVNLLKRFDVFEELVLKVEFIDVPFLDGNAPAEGVLEFGEKEDFEGADSCFGGSYHHIKLKRVQSVQVESSNIFLNKGLFKVEFIVL